MLDGLQRLTSDFFLVNTGMAMIYSITHVWHVGWVATPYLGFLLRKHRYGNVFHSVARTSSCSSYCRVEEILHSHRSGLRFAGTSSAGFCRQVPQVGRHFSVKFVGWAVAFQSSSSCGPSLCRQVPRVGRRFSVKFLRWVGTTPSSSVLLGCAYTVKFSFVGPGLRRQVQFCWVAASSSSSSRLGYHFAVKFSIVWVGASSPRARVWVAAPPLSSSTIGGDYFDGFFGWWAERREFGANGEYQRATDQLKRSNHTEALTSARG